jgi:hypothetical protein
MNSQSFWASGVHLLWIPEQLAPSELSNLGSNAEEPRAKRGSFCYAKSLARKLLFCKDLSAGIFALIGVNPILCPLRAFHCVVVETICFVLTNFCRLTARALDRFV